MKCIHFYNPENRIVRLADDEAEQAVLSKRAHYVSKSEWKRKVRDLPLELVTQNAKRRAVA